MTDAARPTRAEALREGARRLAAAGVAEAGGDARALLRAAAAIDAEALLRDPDAPLDADAAARFAAMIAARAAGAPVGRIRGRRAFWGREFELCPDALEPRPETELLVEIACARLPAARPARVLDLGTGSGCVLTSVLAERPRASGVGVDLAPGAAAIARRNARAAGVADRAAFVVGDWGAALGGRFDAILANPPYIPSDEIAALAAEVRGHDPRRALDGGVDGLAAIRRLLVDVPRLAAPGALLAIEIGAGQATAAAALIAAVPGARDVGLRRDLAGIHRCVMATLNRPAEE